MLNVDNIQKIVVIGFGTMGSGIAQVLAQNGYNITAIDMNDELVKRGLALINSGPFGLDKAIQKGRITTDQAEAALARIETSTLDNIRNIASEADFIIEAVYEDINLKEQIFNKLDSVAPSETIIASNTSTLSISAIGGKTKRPEKVVGMHFFNPPQLMKLVEVIRGVLTAEETVKITKTLAEKLGKTVVLVNRDIAGFIANRIGIPPILDAIRLYEGGVASAQDIDTAMKAGYNWPMGPLELCDLVGLDVVYASAEGVYMETGSPTHKAPALLTSMVKAGLLGRKTGRGFYNYK